MNVIDLISSMEDVVLEGQIPLFKSKSIINIDEFLDMLDEMKKLLPQELQAANHLRSEKNKLIIEAQQEAQTLMEDVAREADRLVMENDITQGAYMKSKQIMNETQAEMDELKQGTYEYLIGKMDELSEQILKINDEINSSKQELKEYFSADDEQ